MRRIYCHSHEKDQLLHRFRDSLGQFVKTARHILSSNEQGWFQLISFTQVGPSLTCLL